MTAFHGIPLAPRVRLPRPRTWRIVAGVALVLACVAVAIAYAVWAGGGL